MSQENVEALQRAGRESGIEFDSPYGLWPSLRTARSPGTGFTSTTARPSKPPGFRSRRCPRRTWRSCAGSSITINQGDIDRAMEAATQDFEMDLVELDQPTEGGLTGGVNRSERSGCPFSMPLIRCTWDPTEFVEVDESRLIVVNHTHLRGRGSGVEVEAVGAQLWTINHDGSAQSLALPIESRSPRSRRAVGVGDAAGERRERG